MSLIIASNKISDKTIQIGEHQSPYSWSNHLNQPIKISPNSEVAVQSLKINKDGTISVNPAIKWYIYFGTKLEDGTISYDNVASDAHIVDLDLGESTELGVDEFAERIQQALNRGVPTPETFGLAKCTAIRNASGTDFQGFNFEFSTRTTGKSLDNKPQKWDSIYQNRYGDGVGLTFNSASNTLTPIAQYKDRKNKAIMNVAIAEDTPLSTNGGEFIVDLSNAPKTGWAVGLRRVRTGKGQYPSLYNPKLSDLAHSRHFSDFSIYSIQDRPGVQNNPFKLRAYHSAHDSQRITDRGTDPTRPLGMLEVDYTTNGSLTDIYNWSTNASNANYDKLKFIVNNELVKVEIHNASGWVPMVETKGIKTERFNPVRDTCRNLYPFIWCTNNASNNSYLTIDKWSGRDLSSDGFLYNNTNNDWSSYLARNGLTRRLGAPLESRDCLDMDSATAHTYKGINASGVPEYDFVMVVKPDSELYTNTNRANADRIFGFENVIRIDTPTKSGTNDEVQTYKSNEAPSLKSTTSIFVRLNNLPVKSYNAGQSRRSQIIYSAPRFSTGTDQSVGALFFESPEKTYVSLDNPTEINLNTIDIDIVNENETLAKDLLGKSVCTLHIREKAHKL